VVWDQPPGNHVGVRYEFRSDALKRPGGGVFTASNHCAQAGGQGNPGNGKAPVYVVGTEAAVRETLDTVAAHREAWRAHQLDDARTTLLLRHL
jgi:hypothetical protein